MLCARELCSAPALASVKADSYHLSPTSICSQCRSTVVLRLQVHSQMAASAWLATSEHQGKVHRLKEELRRQHGSPCLPLLDRALRHGRQVSRCCYEVWLCCPLSVVLERQKAAQQAACTCWSGHADASWVGCGCETTCCDDGLLPVCRLDLQPPAEQAAFCRSWPGRSCTQATGRTFTW